MNIPTRNTILISIHSLTFTHKTPALKSEINTNELYFKVAAPLQSMK